jgi:hypothetical protein
MGLGVVLRDHTGKLIASQSQTKEGHYKNTAFTNVATVQFFCHVTIY